MAKDKGEGLSRRDALCVGAVRVPIYYGRGAAELRKLPDAELR